MNFILTASGQKPPFKHDFEAVHSENSVTEKRSLFGSKQLKIQVCLGTWSFRAVYRRLKMRKGEFSYANYPWEFAKVQFPLPKKIEEYMTLFVAK